MMSKWPVFSRSSRELAPNEIAYDAQRAWALWWWRASQALVERDHNIRPSQPLGFGLMHAVHRYGNFYQQFPRR